MTMLKREQSWKNPLIPSGLQAESVGREQTPQRETKKPGAKSGF